MNISCEIIADLIPLYLEGICSEESKKLVEEHLLSCHSCSEMVKRMQTDCEMEQKIDMNLQEAESIRNLSQKWNKQLILSALAGILSTLIIVGLSFLIFYCFVGIKIG